jgi:hypothetical protein
MHRGVVVMMMMMGVKMVLRVQEYVACRFESLEMGSSESEFVIKGKASPLFSIRVKDVET